MLYEIDNTVEAEFFDRKKSMTLANFEMVVLTVPSHRQYGFQQLQNIND